jgi:hypothetical protein
MLAPEPLPLLDDDDELQPVIAITNAEQTRLQINIVLVITFASAG